MKRNIKRTIENYDKQAPDLFTLSDVRELEAIAQGDLYEAITAALKVGYMTGYKRGRQDARSTKPLLTPATEKAGRKACEELTGRGRRAFREIKKLAPDFKLYQYVTNAPRFCYFFVSEEAKVEGARIPAVDLDRVMIELYAMIESEKEGRGQE